MSNRTLIAEPQGRAEVSTRTSRRSSDTKKRASGGAANGQLPPGRYKAAFYPRPAAFWEKEGVPVRRIPLPLAADERETAIGWLHVEELADVSTSEPRWMQRIESLGFKPSGIDVYHGGGEIRLYNIPKRLILLPSKAATVSKAVLDQAERTWRQRCELERQWP